MDISRRSFFKMAGLAVGGVLLNGVDAIKEAEAAEGGKMMKFVENLQVPYSTGRAVPTIDVPENACDAAHHIFDPVHFPYKPTDVRNQPPATVDVYRLLQQKLGLTRSVVVQASAYGTDNRCLLDALRQLGPQSRGVAVVDPSITDEELADMHQAGVRGLRYNVSRGAKIDPDALYRMADRIKDNGWHMAFWIPGDNTLEYADMFKKLPVKLVFDHRGHIPQAAGVNHPAFKLILGLMKEGKAYVKLSALYHDSNGENDYADTVAVGKAYCDGAPTQVVWGTDWPHPSEFTAKKDFPDDAHLLDLLAKQAPDVKVRHRILVDNPAELFGF